MTLVATGGSRVLPTGNMPERGKRIVGEARKMTAPVAEKLNVLAHSHAGVGGYVDLVPKKLRPAAVTGLGVGLLRHSLPTTRTTYTPVRYS